ncbi:MAG: cytochrome-c peroxidase, partial [Bacteroidia bacterium]
ELIREHLNPLYGHIRAFQIKMGIETHNQISARQQSVNYQANSPFATDFLNSYYYTYQSKSAESLPQLALGKFLFYEPAMSADAKMSCASCHQPNRAFTDGLARSLDNSGQAFVPRNAPTLLNAVYAQRHFYDLRADKLENQLRDVFHSEREFQSDFVELVDRLQESAEYMALFRAAYPRVADDKMISRHTIVSAMTAYVRTLQSFDSPFDRYIRRESAELDPQAIKGFNLFMGKANCGTCHFPPTFSGLVPPDYHENETEVLGVPADKAATRLDPDEGRILNKRYHEQADHYRYSFKTMTVRNVALTGPYMHNGVFETLGEVLDFYNQGGGAGMGLEVPHQTLGADPLELSKSEQKAIIRFMESLTDTVGTTDYPRRLPAFDAGSELEKLDRSLSY